MISNCLQHEHLGSGGSWVQEGLCSSRSPPLRAGQNCLSVLSFPTESAVLTKFQFHVTKENTGHPRPDPFSCSAFSTLGNYPVEIDALTSSSEPAEL